VEADGFGRLLVDGELWEKDIYLLADGSVKKRKKRLAKEAYGTGHVVGPRELELVCEGDPQVLVVGTGYGGALSLSADGRRWLQERGIALEMLRTPEAARRFCELQGRRAALFHVTC
jgi:hypothetical protein